MNAGSDRLSRTCCRIAVAVLLLAATGCTWTKRPDLRLLAPEVMKNTPEQLHFAEGTHFRWVLLDAEVTNNPAEFLDEAVRLLGQKYAVYRHDAVLPDNLVTRNAGGEVTSCRGGFVFRFQVQFVGWRTVEILYWDFEADEAGSSHVDRYRWTGSGWKLVMKGPLGVS